LQFFIFHAAINILKAFDNFPNANAGEKAKLKQAIEQIENKRFQSLGFLLPQAAQKS
jgi:hypothetical protein